MSHQYFTENGNQKFPLSTQALAFMQEQIELAYGLTDLAGRNIIVREPTASVPGLVIYDGELLPLTGTVPTSQAERYTACIAIAEQTETLSVEGQFEGNVRTTRSAYYASRYTSGVNKKNLSDFTTLKSISALMSELTEAKRHTVPTGAIMMWSGTIANIPTGWALCNGQNGTPDLQGRFIVGASTGIVMFDSVGYNYPVGTTGGKNKVALGINQMPSHSHDMVSYNDDYNGSGSGENGDNGDNKPWLYGLSHDSVSNSNYETYKKTHSNLIQSRGGGEAHENRPVFYALAYIMKII